LAAGAAEDEDEVDEEVVDEEEDAVDEEDEVEDDPAVVDAAGLSAVDFAPARASLR
jgi:hypothetical protein